MSETNLANVEIKIKNDSDSCTFDRRTVFRMNDSEVIKLIGSKSIIKCLSGVVTDVNQSFSGYFPRLTSGENMIMARVNVDNSKIDSINNVLLIIKTPIARWIT